MGLAAAYQLARDGHRPVVFEADDRVGGMTACFDFNGLDIERFYHFHCTSDTALFQILDELGIADKLQWAETRMGYWYQGKVQAWGNPLALLRFRGLSLMAKLRYGLHAFLCTKRDNWRPLDALQGPAWIRKWVGAEAWDVLWRRLFEYKFYDYAEAPSAAWVWSRIRRIGRSRSSLFHEKLGTLDGGSTTLLSALSRDIERRGGEIRLRSPVREVVISDGRVTGVHVAGSVEPFDKVISTVPLPLVPALIPDLPAEVRKSYAAIRNVAVVCVIAKLRKPLTENFWLNVNDPEMDIPGLVEYSNLRKLEQTVVYVPFYMPGELAKYAEPNDVFADKVRRYLMKINPAVGPDDIVDIKVSRYRFAQPVCEPGFLTRLPPVELPVGGLWVADTSYYYPEDRGISESIDFGRRLAKMAAASPASHG